MSEKKVKLTKAQRRVLETFAAGKQPIPYIDRKVAGRLKELDLIEPSKRTSVYGDVRLHKLTQAGRDALGISPEPAPGSFMPVEVTDIDLAFPAKVDHLMPPEELPPPSQKARNCFSAVFFGNAKKLNAVPKKGVDATQAIRHIKVIMGSFSLKHEVKEEAVAQLFDLWFEDVDWGATTEKTHGKQD